MLRIMVPIGALNHLLADTKVIRDIKALGNTCIKVATYGDACAAVTRSSSHYYTTHESANLDEAKGRALTMCANEHNDGTCKIVVAACSGQAASSGR